MAVPGLVRAALFHIIIAWNDFLFGLLLTMHKAVAFTVESLGYRVISPEPLENWSARPMGP